MTNENFERFKARFESAEEADEFLSQLESLDSSGFEEVSKTVTVLYAYQKKRAEREKPAV